MSRFRFYALVVASFLFGISALCEAQDECKYDECIYTGLERANPIERYIIFLNISLIPDDVLDNICPKATKNAQECLPARANCNGPVRKEFHNRLYDGVYVAYIVDLAVHICQNAHDYMKLKGCFTPELEDALHSCIFTSGYDLQCIHSQYKQYNECSPDIDATFSDLVDKWLASNPYIAN